MGLSVRSSRCAVISMIIFGLLIYVPAGFYITFSIIRGHPGLQRQSISQGNIYKDSIVNYAWYLGYTSLLALITMITGCIGVCASGRRAHRDTCLTVTLFIFSLIVAGLSAYTIYDFSMIISITRILIATTDHCSDSFCRLVFLGTEGSLLGLAILVFLLSSWAIICCLASFCCHSEVEPEPALPARQQVGGQQGVMMQGAVMVPMMRTDTIPVVTPPHYAMMQPAQGMPVAPVNQAPQQIMAPVNQPPQQQSQAMPVQVVGHPVVMKTDQERNDETVA